MRTVRGGLASLLLSGLSAVGFAHAAEPVDCANATSTVEMNICAGRDFEAADARLNRVYADVLARVRASDLPPPFDVRSWEAALREAQRAWVRWRDLDCGGLVPKEWSGGTGTTVAVLACRTEKTEQRIKDLEERYAL